MKHFQDYYASLHLETFQKKVFLHFPKKVCFFILPVWIFFWLAPWTFWLNYLPWMRLSISLLLFITPGMVISILLMGDRFSLLRHFIGGIAFSILLVSILGIVGRVFHTPFDFIKLSFALAGLIALVVLFGYSNLEAPLYKSRSFSFTTLVTLLLMIAFGIIINFMSRTTGDDQTYLAYLTSWEHASHLNFEEVFFGSGNLDSIRFWLAIFPMSLALLAEISHLHGLLLIGFYLEPFLIVIALLAIYDLYELILQSEYQAVVALFLQFTFLFLLRGYQQPGLTFFNRLSEDKVFAAFILFPIFLCSTYWLLEHFDLRSVLYFLFSGFSLALTHPVILAFSTFIIGLYISIITIRNKEYRKTLFTLLLLAVVIAPISLLRFIEVSSSSLIPYDLESALEIGAGIETRISYLAGTPYYGFNWDRVAIELGVNDHPFPLWSILSRSYLWIAGIGFLWSVANIKSHTVAPFVTATSALVLLSAIPYTGWLIGYFVSARMLWRTPWMIPIGLIGLILLNQALHSILPKIPIKILSKLPAEKAAYTLIMGTSFFLIVFFSIFIYRTDWRVLNDIKDYKNTLEKLSGLGEYLEANIEEPAIFLASAQSSDHLTGLFTQSLMDYLPGLSSKSKVVLFRGLYPPYPVYPDKFDLIFSLDKTITPNQRTNILRRNHVQYVLLDNSAIIQYYASKSQFFDLQQFGNYVIVRIHGASR